jgi:sigma-54-specific transcriptional regulator
MTLLKLPAPDPTVASARAKALVFEDPRSKELLRVIQRLAPSQATVLITGETGTGKEIVARHLHDLSARATGPFLAVNCGAFSETLVESELFGHERGSFTGATASRPGWFEAANGGTLFLDEIGDLPPPVQVKLLRVLQEREVVRVGSRNAQSIDVRLVAATNVDLTEAVAAGRFREDLYYRLNVASIALPPLRDRPGDILPLARYFLDLYRHRLGLERAQLSCASERALLEHSWPGNIRELDNVMHRALLVFPGEEITASDLRLVPLRSSDARRTPGARRAADRPEDALEAALLSLFEQGGPALHAQVEQQLMRAAYHFCDRNQVQTAKLLGLSRNIVRARLMLYGVIARSRRSSSGQRSPLNAEPPPLS